MKENNWASKIFVGIVVVLLVVMFFIGVSSKNNSQLVDEPNKPIREFTKENKIEKKENSIQNKEIVKKDEVLEIVVNTSGLLKKKGWYELEPKGFNFKIQFPNKPKLSITEITTNGEKKRYTWSNIVSDKNDIGYALSVYEIDNKNLKNSDDEDLEILDYIIEELEGMGKGGIGTEIVVDEKKFAFNDFEYLPTMRRKEFLIQNEVTAFVLAFRRKNKVYIIKSFFRSTNEFDFEHVLKFMNNNLEFTDVEDYKINLWKKEFEKLEIKK